MMIRLILSGLLVMTAVPLPASDQFGVCNQPFTFVQQGHRVVSNGYSGGHVVQKRVVQQHNGYQQNHYVANQVHRGNDVLAALQEIAKQKQEYSAMVDGLNALGFSSQQSYQQQYSQQGAPAGYSHTPFGAAPYQQGTTAYSVREVEVDAFGPDDVRELMASVSRYSSEANVGANQLMLQANEIANEIASSVQRNSETALRVAEIEAETRGVEVTAKAIADALRASRPQVHYQSPPPAQAQPQHSQSQGRVSVRSESSSATVRSGTPPPTVAASRPSVALLKQHCVKCHGANVKDPSGGFRLAGWLRANDADAAIAEVLGGTMPPPRSLPDKKPLPREEREMIAAELRQLVK